MVFLCSRASSARWVSFSLICWRWTIRSGPAVRTIASPWMRSIQNLASLPRTSRSSGSLSSGVALREVHGVHAPSPGPAE